jgi:hypothetical protein
MKSAAATTFELDDPGQAARELALEITGKLAFAENSIGILLCDADMDVAALTGELRSRLGFDIAGMTTLATIDEEGHQSAAAILTVLTADDCFFCMAASDPLHGDDHEEKIARTLAALRPEDDAHGQKPGIVLAFCPPGMPFSGDVYPDVMSRIWPDTPVIGGVASDDYDYERVRVFLSGLEYRDSLVAVAVWGNVRPVFSLRHVTSRFAERIRPVTSAQGNIVYTVGDETFVDYLKSFGLKTDVSDPLFAFTSFPMMLTSEEGDEVSLMRHIGGLNPADGSGSFLGDVPEGAMANICLINKNDITESCRQSFQALLDKAIDQRDYKHSTILCLSCCGRAMILGADSSAEGRILAELKPEGFTLAGAYCLGEICPTSQNKGRVSNRFHNCSITFCMV